MALYTPSRRLVGRRRSGFTLIELLVVIAIIGVLSSVVLASLNASREKARVARTLQDFREIEKALYLWADDENRTTWWTDGSFGGNPSIAYLITNTGLSDFLSVAPKPPQGGSTFYFYDNDGDTYTCGGSATSQGVNIILEGVDVAGSDNLFTQLDEMVDGGDGGQCGKITRHGVGIMKLTYKISDDGSF